MMLKDFLKINPKEDMITIFALQGGNSLTIEQEQLLDELTDISGKDVPSELKKVLGENPSDLDGYLKLINYIHFNPEFKFSKQDAITRVKDYIYSTILSSELSCQKFEIFYRLALLCSGGYGTQVDFQKLTRFLYSKGGINIFEIRSGFDQIKDKISQDKQLDFYEVIELKRIAENFKKSKNLGDLAIQLIDLLYEQLNEFETRKSDGALGVYNYDGNFGNPNGFIKGIAATATGHNFRSTSNQLTSQIKKLCRIDRWQSNLKK